MINKHVEFKKQKIFEIKYIRMALPKVEQL